MSHYTSWSAGNWFFGYAVIGGAVALAMVAVGFWVVGKSNEDDLGVLGIAAVFGVVSLRVRLS